MAEAMKRSVLVASTDAAAHVTWRAVLEPAYELQTALRDADQVAAAVEASRPDAVVLDLSTPGTESLELVSLLRTRFGDLRVIVVTMFPDWALADRALEVGASGLIPRLAAASELRAGVNALLAGERYVSPRVGQAPRYGAPAGLGELTPREQQIVRFIGQGMTSEQIAASTRITRRTYLFTDQVSGGRWDWTAVPSCSSTRFRLRSGPAASSSSDQLAAMLLASAASTCRLVTACAIRRPSQNCQGSLVKTRSYPQWRWMVWGSTDRSPGCLLIPVPSRASLTGANLALRNQRGACNDSMPV
jgi:DNA-binding NarL/FixJ family response regulator